MTNAQYGIDLGTTNSLIARSAGGEVEVLKNPRGFKETLPSVVGYRKGRILVGEAALAYVEKSPHSVFGGFKRKMGTSETFRVEGTDLTVSPVELSAEVLKELKTFAIDKAAGAVEDPIVTVPASFDVVQSDATRRAGKMAGFRRVRLLQEPVAASLAYANRAGAKVERTAPWLVYDLGGGTFDAALVRIDQGEIVVVDHEGDNYLGGRDFDNLLISDVIVPRLQDFYGIRELADMRRASSRFNQLYYWLLKQAEQARVDLTTKTSTEILIQTDHGGIEMDCEVPVARAELERLIEPHLERTAEMIRSMLQRRKMGKHDLQFAIMVGGVTYTPLVRMLVESALGVPIHTDLDPTNAVAVGAAHYAATRPSKASMSSIAPGPKHDLSVRLAYSKASRKASELLAARVDGNTRDMFYRIARADGGFDSGRRKLAARVYEELPLVADRLNEFCFEVYDGENQLVFVSQERIIINQGRYAMPGQPLAHDICLEVDDLMNNRTSLETIFAKNSCLPMEKRLVRTLSRSVSKGSDECVIINVYEGPSESEPSANRRIGQIKITGHDVNRFLIKGSDLHLVFQMSESRELKVTAAPQMVEQEFSEVFAYENRHVDIPRLKVDLEDMMLALEHHLQRAAEDEDYTRAANLNQLQEQARLLQKEVEALGEDDVTDARYQLEDRKCRLTQQISGLTRDAAIREAQVAYLAQKDYVTDLTGEHGTQQQRNELDALLRSQESVASSSNVLRLGRARHELAVFAQKIHWKLPGYHRQLFAHLRDEIDDYEDYETAERLIKEGDAALRNGDEVRLALTNEKLLGLLSRKEQVRVVATRQVGIA